MAAKKVIRKFHWARDFEEGFAIVKAWSGKYGHIKPDGSWLVEPKFDDVENFHEGFAAVALAGKYGFIKTDGSWLVEPRSIKWGYPFHNGFAIVEASSEQYRFLKSDGSWMVGSDE